MFLWFLDRSRPAPVDQAPGRLVACRARPTPALSRTAAPLVTVAVRALAKSAAMLAANWIGGQASAEGPVGSSRKMVNKPEVAKKGGRGKKKIRIRLCQGFDGRSVLRSCIQIQRRGNPSSDEWRYGCRLWAGHCGGRFGFARPYPTTVVTARGEGMKLGPLLAGA